MKARVWFVLIAFLVAAGAAALGVSTLEGAAETETTLGPNLLFNPSFETYDDYEAYDPPGGHPDCDWGVCGSAQMAPGWTPYWRSWTGVPADTNVMPEYKPASTIYTDPLRVRTGSAAQVHFTFWRTHEAGFYQQAVVVPGETYCFSIWAHSWSADDDDDAYSGPMFGNLRQRVGIDPAASGDWQSNTIVWGSLRVQPDIYEPFVVTATADVSTMIVYAYSHAEWAVKHNDTYWDDANLRQVDPILSDGPLSLVTTIDRPLAITRTINANWLCDPETSWEVNLDPDGTLTPLLSAADGATGDALTVSMGSQGLAAGTYETALHFSSPDTSFAVATIPASIHVLPHDNDVFLPTMVAGQ